MRTSSRYVLPLFLLVVFVGPVVLGPIFYAVAEPFGVPFHRAINRALMVSALVAHFLFRNRLHFRTWWPTGSIAWRQIRFGLTLALASSLAMILLVAVIQGVQVAPLSAGRAAVSILLALIAALIVPLLEETLFRGFLVTTLVEVAGRRAGWVLAALIFALAHFLKVPSTFHGQEDHGWSGLTGMAAAFAQLAHGDFVSGRGLNLFLVGLILGGIFLRVGTLWIGAALHGGWIFVLMSFTVLTRSIEPARITWLSGDLLSSPLTSAVLLALGIGLWRFLPDAAKPVAP